MNDDVSANRILRIDPEHGGVRLGTLLAIVLGFVGGFLLVRLLLGWLAADSVILDFASVISCVGALPIALGFAWLVERFLKDRWSSGRQFEMTGSELRYSDTSSNAITLDFDQRVNLTCWSFRLSNYPKAGRERLVPEKWLTLVCQMQQDDKRLITFAYMPPERAQEISVSHNLEEPFHEISLAWLYKEAGKRRLGATTRPEIPSDMLAGPDGRYWIAERRRWEEGLELTPDDFAILMDFVEKKKASNFDVVG